MNNKRRKRIQEIISEIEKIKEQVYDIQLDEEMAFDSMPEGLQSSERGEISEEAIELLDSACDGLGEVLDCLNDIR